MQLSSPLTWAAARFNAMVLLLLIHWLLLLLLFLGVCVWSLFSFAVFGVLSGCNHLDGEEVGLII